MDILLRVPVCCVCRDMLTIPARLCTSRVSCTCDGGLYPGLFDCSVTHILPEKVSSSVEAIEACGYYAQSAGC